MTNAVAVGHDRRLAEAVILGQISSRTEYTRGLSRMARELNNIRQGLAELHEQEHSLFLRRQMLLGTAGAKMVRAAEHGTESNIQFSVAHRDAALGALQELQSVLHDLGVVREAVEVHESQIIRLMQAQEEVSPSILGGVVRQIIAWSARMRVAESRRQAGY